MKVKCPKCKENLKIVEIVCGSMMMTTITRKRYVCTNKECLFFGIPRLYLKDGVSRDHEY